MRYDVDSQIQLHNRAHRKRRVWHRVVTTLGCIVIFVTTYALILPAITLESTPDTYCGQEVHQHDNACWEIPGTSSQIEISCHVPIHRHTADCYDEMETLICTIPDGTVHSHTADCFDEAGTLICTEEDYLVHQHDSFCFDTSGELICTLPELAMHEHDESCYDENGRLSCGKNTPLRHQHTADCITTIPATEPQGLLCTIPEHTHTEACFDPESNASSEILKSLSGKRMAELTEEECLALRELALTDISENELAQLSEEDISTLMQQALLSLGGLPDEETNLLDKSLLEMTGAELASLTDEEIAARTEEFLALTDEEFNALNQRMSQAANEAVASASYGDAISDSEESILLGQANETTARTVAVDLNGTITITDDVSNSGCYVASYSGGTESVTFKWYRTDAGGAESVVARKYYRIGDVITSNISGDSLEKLNLALDGGTVTNSCSSVTYRAVLCIDGVETDISGTITNTTHQGEVLNGSFETPVATTDYQPFIESGADGIVWKTTASDGMIELLSVNGSSYQKLAETWHGISTVPDGTQCAEVNAESTGALYQTVVTTPGLTMSWQVDHMARTRSGNTRYSGTDSMYVVIMETQKASAIAGDTAQILKVAHSIASGQTTVDGVDYTGAYSQLCTSDSKWTRNGRNYTNTCTWQTHSGSYTIPAGQYSTTYFFVAADTASGDDTIGNHIDNVWFSTEAPTPTPNDAKLELSKNVYGELDETALNELLYSLNFNLIRDSDGTVLRTVHAYELGSWSKLSDDHWKLTKTISVTDLLGETIRVEEAGYALDGFEVETTSRASPFTVENQQSYTATFDNTYTVPNCTLKLTKHVSASDTSGTFGITASYQNGTETITKSFELGNNDSDVFSNIPLGAWVTVSEPSHDGYTVCIKDSTGTLLTDSDYYSFTITEDTEIHIYNAAGVLLPETGGASPYLFIYGGLLLMLTAVVAGFILRRRWRKEGSE